MIYAHSEEIILLYSSDGRATIHNPESMSGIPTTKIMVERWRKWFDILNDAEDNPSLKLALEQAEFIYDLCRDNR